MKNIQNMLNGLQKEFNNLKTENIQCANLKKIVAEKKTLNLYRCVIDDCEVTIVEYILAESEEGADKIFGWTNWDGLKIDLIMNAEDLSILMQNNRVRTIDEDFD